MRHWCRHPGASCPVLLCRLIKLIKSQVQILGHLLPLLSLVWPPAHSFRNLLQLSHEPSKAFRLKYVHVPLSEVMPLRHIRGLKWMDRDLWEISTELVVLFCDLCPSIWLEAFYCIPWGMCRHLGIGLTGVFLQLSPRGYLTVQITPCQDPSSNQSLLLPWDHLHSDPSLQGMSSGKSGGKGGGSDEEKGSGNKWI